MYVCKYGDGSEVIGVSGGIPLEGGFRPLAGTIYISHAFITIVCWILHVNPLHWPCHPFLCLHEICKVQINARLSRNQFNLQAAATAFVGDGIFLGNNLSPRQGEIIYSLVRHPRVFLQFATSSRSLGSLFNMPPAPLQLLRQLVVDTSHLPGQDPSGWVHPMLQVVPMGWSWTMWLSQRIPQFQFQLGPNIGMTGLLAICG